MSSTYIVSGAKICDLGSKSSPPPLRSASQSNLFQPGWWWQGRSSWLFATALVAE